MAVAGCVDGTSQVLGGEDVESDGEADAAGEVAEGVEPQARIPKLPVDPGRPTKKEIEVHDALPLLSRAWCPPCVRGSAMTSPHPRKDAAGEDKRME